MKNRTPLLVELGFAARRLSFVTLIAAFVIVASSAFGKTASCPCSPCTCSPCTCGAGGKGDKHHDKEKEKEHHGHGGVGVGVDVDLSGVGQRKAEPNPFATTSEPSVPHTQEKTTKKHTQESTATTFDKVDLTSEKAKDLEEPDEHAGTQAGGGTVQISDEKGETTGTPPPQTQEKKKDKRKWPKPVQQWLDKLRVFLAANHKKFDAQSSYHTKLVEFCKKNERYNKLYYQALALGDPQAEYNLNNKNYEAERKKVEDELGKLQKQLEKDFLQTNEGKTALKERDAAEQAEKEASKAQEEAGKYIDSATKDAAAKGQEPPETEAQKTEGEQKAAK